MINPLRRLALSIYQVPLFYGAFGFLMRIASRLFPGRFEGALGDIADIGLGIRTQETKAYSVLGNFGQVYINRKKRFRGGVVEGEEAEEIKRELIKKFGALRDPVNGKKAVKGAFGREEVFSGPLLNEAPDIVLEAGDLWIKPTLSAKEVFAQEEVISHDREGIFGCLGPGLKKGKIDQVSLYDFAPTILNLFGIKIPEDMDGEVISFG